MRVNVVDTAEIDSVSELRVVDSIVKRVDTTVPAEVVVHFMGWKSIHGQGIGSAKQLEIVRLVIDRRHDGVLASAD